jgi:uncharacterized protein
MRTPMSEIITPTAKTDRILALDALRGFALLGVLLANMVTHSGYFFLSSAQKMAMPTFTADHLVEWMQHFLIDGKFYSIFSLLFGMGFALQMSNRTEAQFTAFFRRRLLILFIIGFLHAIFFYVGDILTVYAITGAALLAFRKSKNLLTYFLLFQILPVLLYSIFYFTLKLPPPPDPSFIEQIVHSIRYGTPLERIQTSLGGLLMDRYPDLIFTGRFFKVLAMFLLGAYVVQVNINSLPLKKIFSISMLVGIPLNIALAYLMELDVYYAQKPLGILQSLVYAIGVPALAIAYASGFYLLYQKGLGLTRIFIPVGRMALTNYLLQSIICNLIFIGGDQYTEIGPAYLALIGLGIFALQLIYSPIWLKHFDYGPFEWLWRRLSYRNSLRQQSLQ